MNIETIIKKSKEHTAAIEAMATNDACTVIDGVISPEHYVKAQPRILWILKEANSDQTAEGWSYLENFQNSWWLNDKKCAAISSIKRVMYASYGILHGLDKEWSEFPWYYEKECQESLKEIAFINIKKVPGGSVSSDNDIQQAYHDNRELIMDQIKAYGPDVVIFGGTLKYFDITTDFNDIKEQDKQVSDFGNHYYYGDNRLYLYAYHPACRGAGFTDFGYVMDIVNIYKNWRK